MILTQVIGSFLAGSGTDSAIMEKMDVDDDAVVDLSVKYVHWCYSWCCQMCLQSAVGSCEDSSIFCYMGCFVMQYVMIWHLWKCKVSSAWQGGDNGARNACTILMEMGRILLKLFVEKWVRQI